MNINKSNPSSAIGSEPNGHAYGHHPASLLWSILSQPVLKPEERNFQAASLALMSPDEDHGTALAQIPDYDDEDYGRGYD